MPEPSATPRSGGGSLGASLKRKIGPLPVWAWGAVVVGAFLLYRHFAGGGSLSTAPVGATTALDQTPITSGDNSGGGGGDTGSGSGLGTPPNATQITSPPNEEQPPPTTTTTAPPLSPFAPVTPASTGATVAAGTITQSGQIALSGSSAGTAGAAGSASEGALRGTSVAAGAHHVVREAHSRPKPKPKAKKKKK